MYIVNAIGHRYVTMWHCDICHVTFTICEFATCHIRNLAAHESLMANMIMSNGWEPILASRCYSERVTSAKGTALNQSQRQLWRFHFRQRKMSTFFLTALPLPMFSKGSQKFVQLKPSWKWMGAPKNDSAGKFNSFQILMHCAHLDRSKIRKICQTTPLCNNYWTLVL